MLKQHVVIIKSSWSTGSNTSRWLKADLTDQAYSRIITLLTESGRGGGGGSDRGRWSKKGLRSKREGNKGEKEKEIRGVLLYLPLGEVSQAGHSGEAGEDPGQLSMLRYLTQAHPHT